MAAPRLVLVPGFWLGAWAWDGVADALQDDGLESSALTLPGLDAVDTDRSRITMADHVDAIVDAVRAAGAPVVLAVHSGAAASGYAATDVVPELIAAMVYVDTGPPIGPLDPEFADVEKPMPSLEELREQENLDGLSDEQLETFQQRAVPEPGAALREAPELTDDARLDIPSTVICTAYPSDAYRSLVEEGETWLGALAHLRDVTYVDLPTSHWPMWSRTADLAALLGRIARETST